MKADDKKILKSDTDGLLTYEYLANHIGELNSNDLDELVEIMTDVDLSGQFLASAARYLHAIDPVAYEKQVRELVAATIDKDREHRFLGDILTAIYGDDYEDHVATLSASDNNFRRIYKRLFPKPDSL